MVERKGGGMEREGGGNGKGSKPEYRFRESFLIRLFYMGR